MKCNKNYYFIVDNYIQNVNITRIIHLKEQWQATEVSFWNQAAADERLNIKVWHQTVWKRLTDDADGHAKNTISPDPPQRDIIIANHYSPASEWACIAVSQSVSHKILYEGTDIITMSCGCKTFFFFFFYNLFFNFQISSYTSYVLIKLSMILHYRLLHSIPKFVTTKI